MYRLLAKLKCEVEEVSGDKVILEASSDRPDLFSVEGIARALRPWLELKPKDITVKDSSVNGYAEEIPQRPYVALAVVRDLVLTDEAIKQMMQLQEKIADTYGRRRRKISIGVYDLDKIKPPIYYKLADPDETRYRPLNEPKEMTLREVLEKTDKGQAYGYIIKDMEKYPILADSRGEVLSLVPILNSDDYKVTAETKNVLIDSTGTSLNDVVNAVTIMAYNIAERSRTGIIEVVAVNYVSGLVVKAPRISAEPIEVRVREVNRLLGTSLSAHEIAGLLRRFYYVIEDLKEDSLIVKAPVYRIDVKTWVDVAEDVAMAYGYERLGEEATSLPPTQTIGRIHPIEYVSRKVRDILIGLGFQEVANYMMSSRATQLHLLEVGDREMFVVENPRSERFEGLRLWLAPQLVEVVAENAEKATKSKLMIFEVGDVVIPDDTFETSARVERRVGFAITHEKATLTDGLAYVKAMFSELGVKPSFEKSHVSGFLPERTAAIKACGGDVGFVGEVNPQILLRLGLKNPLVIAEVSLSKIISSCW